MTTAEFTDILDKLRAWRADRHIDFISQRESLVTNMLEEYVELDRAKDVNESIDAICDMYVFLLNAYPYDYTALTKYHKRITLCGHPFILQTLSHLQFSQDDYVIRNNNLEYDFKSKCDIQGHVVSLAVKFEEYLIDLGYNPYLCMLETIKEISSRTGHFDANAKKWIKDTNVSTYKANYSLCVKD